MTWAWSAGLRPRGSRGIHVYVRIEPIWVFFQTRPCGPRLCEGVGAADGGVVTTAWWKEERHGVFVDYNQNARDKTVSSAYGVRPTGFVSAPFTWDELGRCGDRGLPDGPIRREVCRSRRSNGRH